MSRGAARDTPANRVYLTDCPAVESWYLAGPDLLVFSFDPALLPAEIPDGVFFDLGDAPF